MIVRESAAPHYASLLLPVALIPGLWYQGAWLLLVPVIALVMIPVADALVGVDHASPQQKDVAALEARWSYRIVLYVFVLLQTIMLIALLDAWHHGSWSWWEGLLAVLSTGIVTGGIGIVISHELAHRPSWWERALGYLLLSEVCYMHFVLEHVAGHHRNVGLPEDPATARRGEAAYRFILRSVVGQWLHAWSLEASRLKASGRAPYGPGNRMYGWTVVPVALMAVIGMVWDASAVALFAGQSAVAVTLLELVNYVEHYGLERVEIRPGVRDRVRAEHSWESRFRVSNTVLFRLQRHADHHLQPQRRYQALGVHDASPQLPQGYPAMVVAALVPPLWRRMIHPILDARHTGSET